MGGAYVPPSRRRQQENGLEESGPAAPHKEPRPSPPSPHRRHSPPPTVMSSAHPQPSGNDAVPVLPPHTPSEVPHPYHQPQPHGPPTGTGQYWGHGLPSLCGDPHNSYPHHHHHHHHHQHAPSMHLQHQMLPMQNGGYHEGHWGHSMHAPQPVYQQPMPMPQQHMPPGGVVPPGGVPPQQPNAWHPSPTANSPTGAPPTTTRPDEGECTVLDIATATFQRVGPCGNVLQSSPVAQHPEANGGQARGSAKQSPSDSPGASGGWSSDGGRRRGGPPTTVAHNPEEGRRGGWRQPDGTWSEWASWEGTRKSANARTPPEPKPQQRRRPSAEEGTPVQQSSSDGRSLPAWAVVACRVAAAVRLGTPGFGRTAAEGDEGQITEVSDGRFVVKMDAGGIFNARSPFTSFRSLSTEGTTTAGAVDLEGEWLYADETTPESDGYKFVFFRAGGSKWQVKATLKGEDTGTRTSLSVDGSGVIIDDIGGADGGHVKYTGTLEKGGNGFRGLWHTVGTEDGGDFECRRAMK